MIKAIDKSSVHRICSGQVILDLATAVKELVENSLDAGATTVEVRLREQGADGFDVIDNGKGISADNYETLALKHYTSKITKFEDLDGVNSFGFRGEALSSLCAVSEMTVTTATEEQAPFGARLEFERSGRLKGTTTCAREHGTTVAVRKLFDNLPVRLREFKKNGKKEFSKCLDQVQAYALVSTGVRISCSNQSSKGDRILQVATSGNRTMKENFANVFGTKLLHQILELEFNLTLDSKDGDADEDRRIRVTGLISKPLPNYGRSAGDRQFFYINKRPCDLPKLAKVVNEVYRTYNAHQYPMVVLDLQLSPGDFDVNVTPDKRTIFLHREKDLFQALRNAIEEKFTPNRAYSVSQTPKTNSFDSSEGDNVAAAEADDATEPAAARKRPRLDTDGEAGHTAGEAQPPATTAAASASSSREALQPAPEAARRLSRTIMDVIPLAGSDSRANDDAAVASAYADELLGPSRPAAATAAAAALSRATEPHHHHHQHNHDHHQHEYHPPPQQQHTLLNYHTTSKPPPVPPAATSSSSSKRSGASTKRKTPAFYEVRQATPSATVAVISPPARGAKVDRTFAPQQEKYVAELGESDATVAWTLDAMRRRVASRRRAAAALAGERGKGGAAGEPAAGEEAHKFSTGLEPERSEEAIDEFNRFISKEDFRRMQILGQFNLGFIIVRLGDDLFMVDQHASDEKFNYESLRAALKFSTQRLICPMNLEVPAQSELVMMDNMDIIRKNGFELEVNESAPPGRRLILVAIPQHKSVSFNAADLEDLVHRISESSSDENVRCAKALSMLASQACRKSVMIGDPLDLSQMAKIVRHMAELDQPWNCPHGRPTMRHLLDLRKLAEDVELA